MLQLAGGQPLEHVWTNDLGGRTYRIGGDRYIKWVPNGTALPDLAREIERLRWAAPFITVPEVIDDGTDESCQWMITRALDAENAVTEFHKATPERTVRTLGRALRTMHDSLPVAECPYSWSIEDRLALIDLSANEAWPEWYREEELAGPGSPDPVAVLSSPPPIDQLVVCHGDACAPNTLINRAGEHVGYVDLAALGVADRWADLAIATWSTVWNYGPGWEDTLLEAYGVEPDPERTRYYRVLWGLSP